MGLWPRAAAGVTSIAACPLRASARSSRVTGRAARVEQMARSTNCSSSACSQSRPLHSSPARRAAETDFYKTLEVGKSATQKDIKEKFYKLSKRWHPDRNQGSDESKVKFQQVSEAYATIGNETSRKRYDREQSASSFGSPRGGGARGAGMRYDSDNLQRRATASYAWEYQRRNAARAHKRANGPGASPDSGDDGDGFSPFGRANRTHHQHEAPTGSSNQTMFERLAEQQRKREEAFAARSSAQQGSPIDRRRRGEQFSGDEYSGGGMEPLMRFLQLSGIVGFMAFVVNVSMDEVQPKRRPRPS